MTIPQSGRGNGWSLINSSMAEEHTISPRRVQIRLEKDADAAAVQAVNEGAFESAAEARLVVAMREQAGTTISLVADDAGTIVGHIMFSPVALIEHTELEIAGLGPMAVLPQHQRAGIGSALVHAGLEECRKRGFGAVVVLGHPGYYPRFGFRPSTRFGIRSEYDVPDDAFMVRELREGYLDGATGTIRYHAAFGNV